jgi:hypothetical protein
LETPNNRGLFIDEPFRGRERLLGLCDDFDAGLLHDLKTILVVSWFRNCEVAACSLLLRCSLSQCEKGSAHLAQCALRDAPKVKPEAELEEPVTRPSVELIEGAQQKRLRHGIGNWPIDRC